MATQAHIRQNPLSVHFPSLGVYIPEVTWKEKRPKTADANIRKTMDGWRVRVKLLLPDQQIFDRKALASSRTEARKVRDDMYAAFNARAWALIAASEEALQPPAPERLTLQQLAERCRDDWWLARGRSTDVAEQYFQKLRDYCIPVLGADKPIDEIGPSDWDRILENAVDHSSQFGRPLAESTIRKIKATLSSALSCAVQRKFLVVNPIKGIPYTPHRLDEADRLGLSAEEIDDDDVPAKRMLSDTEARALLSHSKDRLLYPMVVLQLSCGLRIAEALAVKWSDFDWDKRELRVRFQVKRRKNSKWTEGGTEPKSVLQRVRYLKSKAGRRNIYLFDDSLELLATLPRGSDDSLVCPSECNGLMEPRNATRLFHRILEVADFAGERPTTHSLRSYRISFWANTVGLPASHLQRLAGHSRIETTLRYYVRGDTDSLTKWLAAQAASPSPFVAPALQLPAPPRTDPLPQSG